MLVLGFIYHVKMKDNSTIVEMLSKRALFLWVLTSFVGVMDGRNFPSRSAVR